MSLILSGMIPVSKIVLFVACQKYNARVFSDTGVVYWSIYR